MVSVCIVLSVCSNHGLVGVTINIIAAVPKDLRRLGMMTGQLALRRTFMHFHFLFC